jgi:dTDP-4-dehydrorhamnose 3,5-epimerase
MRLEPLVLQGAFLVEPEPNVDERGLFVRTWSADEFAERGLVASWAQSSASYNRLAGTLRGLHYQAEPRAEAKLVRCTRGAVFDVIVDLRPGSPTERRWVGLELTEDNRLGVYVPQGLAHGFQTLVDETELSYLISERYDANLARGVRWDDPSLAIAWPSCERSVISERDRTLPLLDR